MADLSRRRDEPLMMRARQAIAYANPDKLCADMLRLLERNDEWFYVLISVPNMFEDIAVLVKHRGASIRLVERFMGGVVISQWEKWAPWATLIRERRGRPAIYANFEELAHRLTRKANRREKRKWGYLPRVGGSDGSGPSGSRSSIFITPR